MNKGLKIFCDNGKDAVLAKVKQIHDIGTVEPVKRLSKTDKQNALTYLMYLQ